MHLLSLVNLQLIANRYCFALLSLVLHVKVAVNSMLIQNGLLNKVQLQTWLSVTFSLFQCGLALGWLFIKVYFLVLSMARRRLTR